MSIADPKELTLAALVTAFTVAFAPGHAQQAVPDEAKRVDHDTVSKADEDDIAKESENPIGNLTVLPFENYTNFDVGPNKGTQNILQFEPVVPIHLTRIGTSSTARSFLSSGTRICRRSRACRRPSRRQIIRRSSRPETWPAAGPWALARSSSSRPPPARPSAPASGAWVRPRLSSIQARISSPACWSTRSGRSAASSQVRAASATHSSSRSPSSTTISATAGSSAPRRSSPTPKATMGRKWTVPVGAVAGRIIKLGGKLPVKLSFGGYYNVVTPQYGARWQLQSVVAVIF